MSENIGRGSSSIFETDIGNEGGFGNSIEGNFTDQSDAQRQMGNVGQASENAIGVFESNIIKDDGGAINGFFTAANSALNLIAGSANDFLEFSDKNIKSIEENSLSQINNAINSVGEGISAAEKVSINGSEVIQDGNKKMIYTAVFVLAGYFAIKRFQKI